MSASFGFVNVRRHGGSDLALASLRLDFSLLRNLLERRHLVDSSGIAIR